MFSLFYCLCMFINCDDGVLHEDKIYYKWNTQQKQTLNPNFFKK